MNGSVKSIEEIVENLNKAKLNENVEVVIAPPDIFLLLAAQLVNKNIQVSAQNVFDKGNGAFTGETSTSMLKDHHINWVIIGHSERRTVLKETDAFIASKTKAALAGGLSVILCIGESLEQREAGETLKVCCGQLSVVANAISDWSNVVIAYEPVWAIGTGKVATTEQAQEAHEGLRKWLKEHVSQEAAEKTRIIYGGSVTDKNSKDLAAQPDIDGFLVGGASLKPAFIDIINSL